LSVHNLSAVVDGELGDFVEALVQEEQKMKLADLAPV
jgi:protein subunit release factor A